MVKKRIIGLALIISALLLFHTTGLWLGESKCQAQICTTLRLESRPGDGGFPADCQNSPRARTSSATMYVPAWYMGICG